MGGSTPNKGKGWAGMEMIQPKPNSKNFIYDFRRVVKREQSTLIKPEIIKQNKIIPVENPSINEHKRIQEYCNPLFCLSCTYFQQIKGNFGRCGVIQKNEKFDGSRKGSGCKLWRQNPDIILKTEIESRPDRAGGYKTESLVVQKKIHHPAAYEFNELIAVVKKERRIKEYSEVNEEILRKLNPKFNAISEKSGSYHYYYMSKTPAHIIDYILLLLSKETKPEEIISKVGKIYAYKIGKRLVKLVELKWQKGLYRQIPDLMRKEVDTHCPKCQSEMVVKNGYGYTETSVLQKIKCKICNYKFRPDSRFRVARSPMVDEFIKALYFQRMSTRKISVWLKTELNIQYTHSNISIIIRKLVPKEQRLPKPQNKSIYKDRTSLKFRQFMTYTKRILINSTNNPKIQIIKIPCSNCNSNNIKAHGIRRNRHFNLQQFQCNDCGKKFTNSRKYSKSKLPDYLIDKILHLASEEKLTSRQISARLLNDENINVTYSSILNWIHKYLPNHKFEKNGSYDKNISLRISDGLKKYFKEHPESRNRKKRGSYKQKWLIQSVHSYPMRKFPNHEQMNENIEPRITDEILVICP